MKSPTRSPRRCPPAARATAPAPRGSSALLEQRGVMPTDYDDWRKIEETETANARPGSPREKFVRVERLAADARAADSAACAYREPPSI